MNEKAKLLIVDDHSMGREALESLLFGQSYELWFADNGHEALELAAKTMPDVILSDVMMPNMDGFELCRQLREHPQLSEVPVILVTALDDRSSRLKGIEAGADDFITKPIDRLEVRSRVRSMTRLNRYRRLVEQRAQLAQAQQRIQDQAALLEIANDAILVLDLEGRIQFWNAAAEKVYGWSKEEVLGQRAQGRILPESSPLLTEIQPGILEHGSWKGEIEHRHRSGRALWLQSRWTLVRNKAGEPHSLLVVNTDVTEQRSLEKQFLRAQRLESLGTLAGGIAHDLNNILAPILMSAQLLRMRHCDPESERMLSLIETSTIRGSDIVRQVLTFARGVEGKRMPVGAASLIREMVKIAKETFPKDIAIECKLRTDLPMISGDTGQLHQVLLNLFVNARDAMPAGGTLSVTAEPIDIDESFASMTPEAKPGSYVLVSVRDTGSGMTPEILERIFEPFFSTKGPGQGTGLGLSTALGVVKSHGGFMKVGSKLGKGTRFQVFLPAAAELQSKRKNEEPSGAPPFGDGECVLLVEDEPAILEVASKVLTAGGYRVLTAADGAQALMSYAEHRQAVRLVLTDLDMPHLNGASLIRTIRKMDIHIPIIAASGLTGSGPNRLSEAEIIGLGSAKILEKPYTSENLLRTVHALLN